MNKNETQNIDVGDAYWNNLLVKWKTVKLQCVNCGQPFTEYNNIGKLKCTQHPVIDRPPPGEPWPCCGAKSKIAITGTNKGCVRCDHSTKYIPYDEAWNTPIPLIIFKQLGIPNNSPCIVNVDNYTNCVTVRRYDSGKTAKNTSHIL